MFNTLSNLIAWTTTSTSTQDEWNTWEVWQRGQPNNHYEKSDIFQYYLNYRPDFRIPEYSAIDGPHSKAYRYCFGDFTPLVINSSGNCDIVAYCNVLLDIYDVCKGITRRLKGDPTAITLMREIVMKRNLTSLHNRDFQKYCYDYGSIHAHTVAQYSLSTLLMRLLTNYLYFACNKTFFPHIEFDICEKAHNSKIFGYRIEKVESSRSIPVSIPIANVIQNDEKTSSSWPRDPMSFSRCHACKRVTENKYGQFNACIDCHLKRICSVCGTTPVVIITDDNLPKCKDHCQLS